MTMGQNGKTQAVSSSAEQVREYTLKTLDLITDWISKGENDIEQPACKWENSAHLRRYRGAKTNEFLIPGENRTMDESTIFKTILNQTLQDGVNPWTHRFLDKLYTTPTTLSPSIELLLGAMNASGVVSSASPSLSLAEEYTIEAFATLLNWDSKRIDGLTMPGGSSSNVLAVQTALGNHFPSFKNDGISGVMLQDLQGRRPLLLTSEQSHYSLEKAALACGMGLSSVQKIKCDRFGRMDLVHLKKVLHDAFNHSSSQAGYPFFINATAGTTILGAFDDLAGIANVVQEVISTASHPPTHPPWIHCDASWGGPVLFSSTSRHLMNGTELVDSLTINPHKLLNITQQCSFGLFRRGETLAVNVTGAKYLFHSATSEEDEDDAIATTLRSLRLNPGSKTMGCGRKPDAFKFYVEWLRVGSTGFGAHVDRAIDYARQVIHMVRASSVLQLAETTSDEILFCQVCFRPAIPQADQQWLQGILNNNSTDTYALLSSATHAVHAKLRAKGKYTIDKAPLVYPHPDVGYYTRLVTHPNTSLEVYRDIVREMEALAREWWMEVKSEGMKGVRRRVELERAA